VTAENTAVGAHVHFAQLADDDLDRLFAQRPAPVGPQADARLLALSLGATLYTPGIRPNLLADIAKARAAGARSQVLCLEDAISDHEVPAALANVIDQVRTLSRREEDLGHLLFVRVREPEQITRIVGELGDDVRALAGFVLPKFDENRGPAYLDAVADSAAATGRRLWALPILESRELIFRETRTDSLVALARVLDKYREHVLALRIGATDLSSVYGLRRRPDVTLWDVHVVASAVADIINVFARAEDGFVITGPVWEYFSAPERLLRTQLRQTPFAEHAAQDLRREIMANDLDGLIREVVLDKVNGMVGKTVIHPSHIHPVHALQAVSFEEWEDARDILAAHQDGGGVRASTSRNKMNEAGPHHGWALRTMDLAQVYGVLRPEVTYVELLDAGRSA
jgi:citrate lyase beta subunit